MTPAWTSICADVCEGRPLLRSLPEGGRLNPTLTLRMGMCNRASALAPWVLLILVFGDHFR